MNQIFVSYAYKIDNDHGFGCMNVVSEGIFSWDDIQEITIKIKKSSFSNNEVDIVILNWRKFDPLS
jgi:hypothetical protein